MASAMCNKVMVVIYDQSGPSGGILMDVEAG